MTNPGLRLAALGILLSIVNGPAMHGQVRPAHSLIVRDGKPGFLLVDRSSQRALDELALREQTVVLYCHFFSPEKLVPRVGAMEVPAGPAGVRQLAAAAGYTLRKLSPRVVRAETTGCGDDEPVLITAQLVSVIGGSIDANMSLEGLEWELLCTASDSVRNNVHGNLFGFPWIATYYWPTRDGHGREFYVQQQSPAGVTVNYPPQRYLRKVSVETVGGTLDVRDLWMDEDGKEPQAQIIDGPVAELELDFDGDGIVDVVCFSGSPGYDGAVGPLHVLSGKTGREIGKIEGFEIVIVEGAGGQRRFKTLDRDGYRTYDLTEDGKLGMEQFQRADADTAEPLLMQVQGTPQGRATVLGLKANEKVVDDFLVTAPTSSNPNAFRSLRVLKLVGERLRVPPGGAKSLRDTHILLDYRPKSTEGDGQAPR